MKCLNLIDIFKTPHRVHIEMVFPEHNINTIIDVQSDVHKLTMDIL